MYCTENCPVPYPRSTLKKKTSSFLLLSLRLPSSHSPLPSSPLSPPFPSVPTLPAICSSSLLLVVFGGPQLYNCEQKSRNVGQPSHFVVCPVQLLMLKASEIDRNLQIPSQDEQQVRKSVGGPCRDCRRNVRVP